MGTVKKLGVHIVRGPAGRGAPEGAYKGFRHRRKPWRKAEFISAAQDKTKGLPQSEALWESNVQNPTYITTVWGYGYKWGL